MKSKCKDIILPLLKVLCNCVVKSAKAVVSRNKIVILIISRKILDISCFSLARIFYLLHLLLTIFKFKKIKGPWKRIFNDDYN